MICVDVSGARVEQPDKVLFEHLDVTISRGDRVAVVGVNGSGKTTLLRILTGSLKPDSGVVRFGRGARITMLEQDPTLPPGTVVDYLGDGWEVAAVATSLGVLPLFDRRTDELSGGQAKRVALAKVLAQNSDGPGAGPGIGVEHGHDMVVLDEPTNHLDLEAIEWLEARLIAMSAALVLVTHDRHALDRLTTKVGPSKIVELDQGRAFIHQAEAGSSAYVTYLDARAARIDREEQEESTRKILARKELAWLRRGAPARTAKPKARLRTAREIVSGGPRDLGVRANDLELGVGTSRLGNQVVELIDVGQQFGGSDCDPTTIFSGVDLVIEPGARLAVVGPNGSGKTTLLDIIAGRRPAALGTVKVGKTVVVGYADQHSTTLDPDITVRKMVAGPHREPDHRDKALLERFWFDSTAQYAPVRMLSGGETRRLQLVMVLARQPNLLILDEPTNDLDLDTLRSLEEFLDDWPGALVVASHDRAFLDRVADHVLAIDRGGSVRRVPGGVGGWLAERAASSGRSGAPAPRQTPPVSLGSVKQKSRPNGPSPSTIGRQLREAEQAMVKAQKRVDALLAELAATTDHQVLAERGAALASAQRTLDELEVTWLELAELADS